MLTECTTCEGSGVVKDMACYGGPPVEIEVSCPDCDGHGEMLLVNDLEPEAPQRTRMRDWKQT